MSTSTPPDGHVVHLLQHWGDDAAPVSLRLKPKLSSASRIGLGVLVAVAAALAVCLILILWIFETPGWWFSLIFTLMVGGFALGIGVAYVEALRSGVRREQASARWAEILSEVRGSPGIVVSRDVATREDGAVPRFALTVRTERGDLVTGEWRPQPSANSLLQSQVPGVGAHVRVWRVEGSPDSDPLVIEVLDPTVAPDTDPSSLPKYPD
jgi:hypothetical protein